MSALKKYDLSGKEMGSAEINESLLEGASSPQSVKDYLVAIRKNARQWSANTKTRAQVNRTGRKPHPQKGQGRSRQGDLAAPQYKGGGIVFGPKPKFDMHVKINRKERRAAIRTLLIEKIKTDKVHVLVDASMESPKTKTVHNFFSKLSIDQNRVLIVSESNTEEKRKCFMKSVQNIPKKHLSALSQMNGYTLALAQDIVVLESALNELLAILG